MEIERRTTVGVELRVQGDGGDAKLTGYAAVYNSQSDDLGGFVEVIAPGAFDSVLGADVRALWQHNPEYVLGRTRAGTLSLSVDENGLRYDVTPPATQWARDAVETIRRGDVSQSSFGFRVARDKFETLPDGRVQRTVLEFAELYDVSPVTFPAYPQTSAEARAMALIAAGVDSGQGDGGEDADARARSQNALRLMRLDLLD